MPDGFYHPLNTLKPEGTGIWVADGPSVPFYGVNFPTRMTVVRIGTQELPRAFRWLL
ncbi:hypothetical protein [Celeribacter sp.]|uniref:hypothetical protein n=1 Tax=Celeribacter sp. TaxID=1890673 RepID=UPI003A9114CE